MVQRASLTQRLSDVADADGARLTQSLCMPRPSERQVVIAPRTLVTLAALAFGGVLLLLLAQAIRGVLTQLVIAIVLAMALEPMVKLFERRGLRRGAAVSVTFGLAVLTIVVFAWLLIPPLVTETTHLIRDAPALLQQLSHGQGPLGFLEDRFHVVERARAAVGSHDAADVIGSGGPAIGVIRGVVATGAAVVTVAFLTLFLSLGGRSWFEACLDVLPPTAQARCRRTGSGIAGAVGGYVAGNLLISLVAGVVTTLLLLATGVPFAVPLGLVVAFFDLIPLVGATIGTVVVAGVALTQGVPTMAIVVVGMVLYQQIENHTLQPLIYHRTVQLSPLAIAVSVAAGAELGGVTGALLGIPAAGAIKVVTRELVAWRRGQDAPPPVPRHGRSPAVRLSSATDAPVR
jgi:predicted PurR-regulated permease PerM